MAPVALAQEDLSGEMTLVSEFVDEIVSDLGRKVSLKCTERELIDRISIDAGISFSPSARLAIEDYDDRPSSLAIKDITADGSGQFTVIAPYDEVGGQMRSISADRLILSVSDTIMKERALQTADNIVGRTYYENIFQSDMTIYLNYYYSVIVGSVGSGTPTIPSLAGHLYRPVQLYSKFVSGTYPVSNFYFGLDLFGDLYNVSNLPTITLVQYSYQHVTEYRLTQMWAGQEHTQPSSSITPNMVYVGSGTGGQSWHNLAWSGTYNGVYFSDFRWVTP